MLKFLKYFGSIVNQELAKIRRNYKEFVARQIVYSSEIKYGEKGKKL